MSFINKLEENIIENHNVSVTENGAIGYKTTGKSLTDLNFAVASLRQKTEGHIEIMFEKAFSENKLYGLKWLMFLRDVRGGLGERRSARVIFRYLANNKPAIMKRLIPLIPEYGRFDDLFSLFGTRCENAALKYIKEQLNDDLRHMRAKLPFSLLAKWLPSENASSKETRANAKKIYKYLGYSPRQYRLTLSMLRKQSRVLEGYMSARKWDKIDYEAVPSVANRIYSNAFLKHDEDRRTEYLEMLKNGKKKINSSVNFPHDIVHKYRTWSPTIVRDKDETLEALWKALPDMVEGDSGTLVVRDGSGSMITPVDPSSSTTALEVATALAIYFSERCSGEFKDKFITFSANPQLIDLSGYSDLCSKIKRCNYETDCSNTNIQKVFELILETAVKNHMKQEELPKSVLIVSDMEFDSHSAGYYGSLFHGENLEPLFKRIEKSFNNAGYTMPRLVFWNVNSRTGTIPVKEHKSGVVLVSGFSVNICKMVLSTDINLEEVNPYNILIQQLDSERYMPVEKAVKGLI